MTSAIGLRRVTELVDFLFYGAMHHKSRESLSNATLGAVEAGMLGVRAIGAGLALAMGGEKKHGVKQVDRLLSNPNFDVWELFASWVPYVIGAREEALVAFDWTIFDADGHSTLVASLVTSHGRTTPLMWLSVEQKALVGQQAEVEELLLSRLREVLPSAVKKVVITADRGFGDPGRWKRVRALGFDFIFRIRGDVFVTDAKGTTKPASEWVSPSGRAFSIKRARVTAAAEEVGTFVAVRAPGMKEPWLLVSSLTDVPASQLIKWYGRRFTIEESFRDIKDLRFGMGLVWRRISMTERRDRLLFISALAIALLTLLGAAGEAAGIDRHFKVNTSKKRQYSLFNQGCEYYQFLPTMRQAWAEPLLREFSKLIELQPWVKRAISIL